MIDTKVICLGAVKLMKLAIATRFCSRCDRKFHPLLNLRMPRFAIVLISYEAEKS
ncbi:hypothetical protein [Microseira sp. BLCC-F43]|uniref:hypothetical protein n=1 Tax=Microseira sp. BLCC-F43 TaxID=3153602 RepID=UPI0035BB709A